MDTGSVIKNTTQITKTHTATQAMAFARPRVSALAITSCVGLLVGLASTTLAAADFDASSSAQHVKQASDVSMTVRVNDANSFEQYIQSIRGVFPGVEVSNQSFNDILVYKVSIADTRNARSIRDMMSSHESVVAVSALNGVAEHLAKIAGRRYAGPVAKRNANAGHDAIGIRPVNTPDDSALGGSGDPQFGNQWHLINGTGGVSTFDNNITPAIHDTLGFTGAGVVVGFPAPGQNFHIDLDHLDLLTNYNPALSQIIDPNLLPDDSVITGWAGIVGAERGNGIAGQGVSPGAQIASFRWSTTIELIEFEAYEWLNQDVDIKFYRNFLEYATPRAGYNNGHVIDYVMTPLENSIRFGRKGNGVVNIFGTGTMFNNGLVLELGPGNSLPLSIFMPDPYNFPPAPGDSFSPIDELADRGNTVADGITNTYIDGNGDPARAYYITGNTNNYPPALNRRSLIIGTVADDGHYDIYAAQGTSVFASVYGGTNNEDQAGPGIVQSVLTTSPGGGAIGVLPLNPVEAPLSATTTGPAIASGIIALMLEANPQLSIRDIQHILFESIQDSTKDPSVKWPNFDITRSYYSPFGGRRSFWQANSGLYSSDTVTNQAIRHSDNYGFGMIDAELAVTKAISWAGTGPLFLLDTGVKGDISDGNEVEDFRVPQPIVNPTWIEFSPADGSAPGTDGSSGFIAGPTVVMNFCVRQNISVESVIVDLSITGEGGNDLYIELISPSGTRSILAMPTTVNPFGTSDPDFFLDDDFEQGYYDGGNIGGTAFAYYQHPFLSWKHWGEKAGGVWTVQITDYGPDEGTPEGAEPGDDVLTEPGANMFTGLGEIGVPGSDFRDDKELVAYRFRIYGTDQGLPIFEGCNPLETNCPGDLNGDGKIDVTDLQIFVSWWLEGNALADLDGDGDVDFADFQRYRGLWSPGFCETNGIPTSGGRPRPGGDGVGSDNDPVVRPL